MWPEPKEPLTSSHGLVASSSPCVGPDLLTEKNDSMAETLPGGDDSSDPSRLAEKLTDLALDQYSGPAILEPVGVRGEEKNLETLSVPTDLSTVEAQETLEKEVTESIEERAKKRLHSRKFREYCNHDLSKDLGKSFRKNVWPISVL
jgi:hypothetical protein